MLPGCGSEWKKRSLNMVTPMAFAMAIVASTALARTAGSFLSNAPMVTPGKKVCVSTADVESSSSTTGMAISKPWRR